VNTPAAVVAAWCWHSGDVASSKDLAWDSTIGKLHLMQFAAQKGNSLWPCLRWSWGCCGDLWPPLKAGWRSHTQMIAIGLSTVAVAFLSAQGVVQLSSERRIPKAVRRLIAFWV